MEFRGHVARLVEKGDRRYGFINIGGGGPDVFFAPDNLADGLEWDDGLQDREVGVTAYRVADSDRLRATKVWPAWR